MDKLIAAAVEATVEAASSSLKRRGMVWVGRKGVCKGCIRAV